MKRRGTTASRSQLSDIESRWLNGEWLIGSEPRTPDETFKALALMAGIGSDALWQAHGNPKTHFWRPGMRLPITLDELRDHENKWLTPDNDSYGGDSYFVWRFYSEDEKQTLWDTHGDKSLYRWESCLRRPIPKGASVDAAMVQFAGTGLTPFIFAIE